jgi:hypothetical protein
MAASSASCGTENIDVFVHRVLADAEHVDEIKQQIAGVLDDDAAKYLQHNLGAIRDMRTAVAEENVRADIDNTGDVTKRCGSISKRETHFARTLLTPFLFRSS